MKAWILIFGLLLSTSIFAEDMQQYLQDTRVMVSEGKYEEALERHIWFHDNVLDYQRSMAGVRLSFALRYWKDLGELYPPALEALKEVRDRKTKILEAGDGDFSLFHDVCAINRTLDENSKTVDLFKVLDDNDPKLAERCWLVASKPVIEAKAYDLAEDYMEEPDREFDKIKKDHERDMAMSERYGEDSLRSDRFTRYANNSFAEKTARLIVVMVASGDIRDAKRIQKRALKIVDNDLIRDAIPPEEDKRRSRK